MKPPVAPASPAKDPVVPKKREIKLKDKDATPKKRGRKPKYLKN